MTHGEIKKYLETEFKWVTGVEIDKLSFDEIGRHPWETHVIKFTFTFDSKARQAAFRANPKDLTEYKLHRQVCDIQYRLREQQKMGETL